MKKIIFVGVLGACFFIKLGAKAPVAQSFNGPGNDINFNVEFAPIKIDNSNSNTLTNITELIVKMNSRIVNYIKSKNMLSSVNSSRTLNYINQSMKFTMQQFHKKSVGFFNQAKDLFFDHKFKLIFAGVVGCYAYLFFKIKFINSYLEKESLWSSWKKKCTMNELLSFEQKQLARDLIAKIQATFIQKNDPANAMSSFVLFIQEVEKELEMLEKYLTLCQLISKAKAWKVFPSCEEKTEFLRERIARLIYFKNIFASWFSDYKCNMLEHEGFCLTEFERRAIKIENETLNKNW